MNEDGSQHYHLPEPHGGFRVHTAHREDQSQRFSAMLGQWYGSGGGYSRTVLASNLNTTSLSNDWTLLESQAASNINLVVRGTLDGKLHGLLYQPASANTQPIPPTCLPGRARNWRPGCKPEIQ